MGMLFWLRRYLVVFAAAFIVIAAAQLLLGHTLEDSASHALLWSTASAAVFLATRMVQSQRNQHCALCRDTPEMRGTSLE